MKGERDAWSGKQWITPCFYPGWERSDAHRLGSQRKKSRPVNPRKVTDSLNKAGKCRSNRPASQWKGFVTPGRPAFSRKAIKGEVPPMEGGGRDGAGAKKKKKPSGVGAKAGRICHEKKKPSPRKRQRNSLNRNHHRNGPLLSCREGGKNPRDITASDRPDFRPGQQEKATTFRGRGGKKGGGSWKEVGRFRRLDRKTPGQKIIRP